MGFETPISNHNAHKDLGASNLNLNLCSFSTAKKITENRAKTQKLIKYAKKGEKILCLKTVKDENDGVATPFRPPTQKKNKINKDW